MSHIDTINFILTHPLNRHRKLRSLWRYVAWQLGSRLVPGPVAVDFVNSARLLAAPGLKGATGNVYVGLHEFEEMAFLLHFLRPGDLFVDIGANIGSYTVLAAACIGAQCIAFEPDPDAFSWLLQNVHLNGVSHRVEVRKEALGSSCGEASFTTGLDTMNHLVVGAGHGVSLQSVAMTTLDQALAGRAPTMLKIDVEGFEADVMQGALWSLQRPELRCVIMELITNAERLRRRMHDSGFAEYTYAPFDRRLSPKGEGGECNNAIFVRDAAFVQGRLQTAPPFTVQDISV
jgi:FkbM family methyltransferase